MNDSPLSLERYVFKRVEITASEKPDAGAAVVLNMTLACARKQVDPNLFLVRLVLKILADQSSDKMPYYTGELSVEGQFRVASNVQENRKKEIVVANGGGMLFGAMREMVSNITARGPWPPLMLATVSFVTMAKKMSASDPAEPTGPTESAAPAALQTQP